MPAVRCFSRTDTFEMKVLIGKRLGSQRAQKYFNLLTRYLSMKLKKSEFDKLCVSILGRENIRLHNELIMSIIQNAALSKIPPQNHVKTDTPLTLKVPNGTHPRTSLQSLCAFPRSPRKGRTPNLRERKFKDRPLHTEKTRTSEPFAPLKPQEQQQSATELVSLNSKPPVEVTSVEDGEEVEQNAISPDVYSRSPVRAPFGVNLHSKETRKVLCTGSDTCHYTGQLPSTNSLKNRLMQKLKAEGLDISMDCVNLLNNGLDSFLKRVIKPSLELAQSRSSQTASMLDFRAATEINPTILGDLSHIQHENY